VYSGVPAHYFGLEQIIDIGPMSGKSNVIFWLERHGVTPTDEIVERIFQKAKQSDRCLTQDEIMDCCGLSAKPVA
jgi:2-isopropylmalate synthase